MTDVLHEHARMLARNLLRLQICTIGEISETLELEQREVQQLAVEVYDERAEQLTALRQIMNDIKERRAMASSGANGRGRTRFLRAKWLVLPDAWAISPRIPDCVTA